MAAITLDAPRSGNRYLKMFYTAQRTKPVAIRWTFFGAWARDEAYHYLKNRFLHREKIQVKRDGSRSLVMVCRDSVIEKVIQA